MGNESDTTATTPHRCEDTEALKDALDLVEFAVEDARKDSEAAKTRLATFEDLRGRLRATVNATRERVRKWGLP